MEGELLHINNKEQNSDAIIKVIGVGGGGGNAVDHMYGEDIQDVTFLLCNTDRQHLKKCSVINTLCIGEQITRGLGAGNKPERARQAAEESAEDIKRALSDDTRMVFITAGMGGGTGTGAAPVIARIAKEMGILTVGIVTIPFLFEGEKKILQAIRGVEEMSKNVDAMLVIKNELLWKVYPEMKWSEAFQRADETLTTATRSISELVTDPGKINLDFADVNTTLSNGGVAIISRGFGTGPNSIRDAIQNALDSPLVNTSNFEKASRLLLYIAFSDESEPDAQIFEDLNNFTSVISGNFDLIWGYGKDQSLGDQVRVTILASGFNVDDATVGMTEEADRKRIEEYYGTRQDGTPTFRNEISVIFSDEEMDDDNFISLVAETPTLRRSESAIERYRRSTRIAQAKPAPKEPAPAPDPTPTKEPATTPEQTPPTVANELDEEVILFGGN